MAQKDLIISEKDGTLTFGDYTLEEKTKVKDFKYTLDEGKSHNAKIKIELDPATGYPTQGHYDFIVDKFIFQ